MQKHLLVKVSVCKSTWRMNNSDEVLDFPRLALLEPAPRLRIPRRGELLDTIEKLKLSHRISDASFDSIYPEAIRRLSSTHWTPVDVARRATELLVTSSETRILDVGSGAGKFCLVGALTSGATFVGIEQRSYLVELCRKLAARYSIEQAQFARGNMIDIDWSNFNGFYLYNPFIENLYAAAVRIDNGLEQTRLLYEHYVRTVQRKLHRAAVGTRVVTYHGFGGDMPPGYICKLREPIASDRIEFWVKES